MPNVGISIANIKKFQDTFQLNIRAELLIKRAQLQGNIVNYAIFRKLDRECIQIQHIRFNLCWELVNFVYYLLRVNIITDPNEIDVILDKCTDLQIEEEEE
ncbi:21858_t:CDS:2 [Entrophospora sp. SA101]|nr:21858_t:CDS:2 [Entrophospora sp. SA101]